jgi:hypothetical protein
MKDSQSVFIGTMAGFVCMILLACSVIGFVTSTTGVGQIRTRSSMNLRLIGFAMGNYEQTYHAFPEDIRDASGQPLLSWRVALLPYLEERQLYGDFRLDEPWDSPHNLPLLNRRPAVYDHPGQPTASGKTMYLGVSGPGLFLDGSTRRAIGSIADGLSNTILVVEVEPQLAVEWTKPGDWTPNATSPTSGLYRWPQSAGLFPRPDQRQVLLGDVSVAILDDPIDDNHFRAWLTIAGGEVVPGPHK